MSRNRDTSVLTPNLGIYLDRPSLALDPRAMRDCLNVRVREGSITRDNMGWARFPDDDNHLQLTYPVMGIDTFFPREGGQFLIILTTRDVFEYDEANKKAVYLTPKYSVGTVDVANGSSTVVGNGTSWSEELKQGDFIHIGSGGQRELDVDWYEIANIVNDTELTLVGDYDGDTESEVDYTARKVFTGSTRNPWSMETFPAALNVGGGDDGDRWYATNGVDRVIAWRNGLEEVYFPDLGDLETARFLTRYKNIMIYGGVRTDGELKSFSIRTSAIGEPENVVTDEAAEFVVHDGVDPLLTAVPIGDNLAIYGERSITLAQFVGGETLFVFRTAISGLGPLSGRAVADFGDFHSFLGPDSQYRFDGIGVQEQGFQIWRDVIRRQSPQRLDLINGHFDEESGELLWVMPLTTDSDPEDGPPERAFVEHYLELVGENEPAPFTIREIPATAMGFFSRETTLTWQTVSGTWEEQNYRWNDRFLQAAFPLNLFGTQDGGVYILNERDSKAGDPITSYVRFGRRALGGIRRKGTVMRVYPFVETLSNASHELEVRVHLTNEPAGRTTMNGPFAYDLRHSTSKNFVSPRRTGRYAEIEFRTEGTGRPWTLQGYDIDVVPAGER